MCASRVFPFDFKKKIMNFMIKIYFMAFENSYQDFEVKSCF